MNLMDTFANYYEWKFTILLLSIKKSLSPQKERRAAYEGVAALRKDDKMKIRVFEKVNNE